MVISNPGLETKVDQCPLSRIQTTLIDMMAARARTASLQDARDYIAVVISLGLREQSYLERHYPDLYALTHAARP